MSRFLFALALVSISFFSCNKEVQPLTKEQINKKIDSLIKAGKQESDEQARIDLERRIKIEVKVKVDSILNAHSLPPKKDTPLSKLNKKTTPR